MSKSLSNADKILSNLTVDATIWTWETPPSETTAMGSWLTGNVSDAHPSIITLEGATGLQSNTITISK